MNPYETRGIGADASLDEINAAYRRKAMAAHPDLGGDAGVFAQLSNAAALLRDPERRRKYDETGATDDALSNFEAGAFEVLVACFKAAVAKSPTLGQAAVIGKAKEEIHGEIGQLRRTECQLAGLRKTLAEARDRLTFEGDFPDILARMMDDELRGIDQQADHVAQQVKVRQRALEMADAYRWRRDPAPTMPTGTMFFTNGTTTTSGI